MRPFYDSRCIGVTKYQTIRIFRVDPKIVTQLGFAETLKLLDYQGRHLENCKSSIKFLDLH